MLKNPLISFIVTSYNYAEYIGKTLDSIKAQTYTDFEVIIVDDCSDDNSIAVVEQFISENQDLRITLIRHDKNLGQLASMIDGLKIAQGVFISFVDSDDVLLKNYAKVHIDTHLSTSVGFTSSQIIEIDENDKIHTTYSIASPHANLPENITGLDKILETDFEDIKFEKVKNKRYGGWYWSPNSSAVYRKSVLDVILGYTNCDKWKTCPDKFLFNLVHLIGGSINIYVPLVAYRRHNTNAGKTGPVYGNKKYHTDKVTVNNIKNNINIRPETVLYLISARKIFVQKFGTRGFIKMLIKTLIP